MLAHLLTLVMACLVTGALRNARAQDPAPSEYQVKAAFLYNFGRFIEWPSGAPSSRSDSFTVCVLGRDPFGSILDETLRGKTLRGKNIAVRRIAKAVGAPGCDILFIAASEQKNLEEVLTTLNGSSVLTVAEAPQFVNRGGMINFEMDGRRVRFVINLEAAERAGLAISAQLLKVASNVKGSP